MLGKKLFHREAKEKSLQTQRNKQKEEEISYWISELFVKAYDEGYKRVTVSISDAATSSPKPGRTKKQAE